MGGLASTASSEMNSFGQVGAGALNSIAGGADDVSGGLNRVSASVSDVGNELGSLDENALNDVGDSADNVTSSADDLTASLNDADRGLDNLRDNPLDDLTDDLNDVDRVTSDLNDNIDDLGDNLDDLNDSDVDELIDDMGDLDDSIEDAADQAGDLGDDLVNAGRRGEQAAGGLGSAFMKVAGILATVFAFDKAKDLATSMVEATGEAEAEAAQFAIVFKDLQGEADKSINGMAKDFGMLPTRLKGTFTKTTSMFKGFGMSTEDSMEAAGKSVELAADAAAFYDVAMKDADGALTSFLKGNTNAAESIGIYATAAGMASFASEKLGLNWKSLDEGGKQLVRLKFVEEMQESAEVTGQAARESEGYENILANLHQAWFDLKKGFGMAIFDKAISGMQLLTEWMGKVDTDEIVGKFQSFGSFMSTTFGPILTEIKTGFGEVKGAIQTAFESDTAETVLGTLKDGMSWIGDNWPAIKETILVVGGAFAALYIQLQLMTFVGTVTGLWRAYQATTFATTLAQHGLNAAMKANPIGLVITGITLLVGAGILLYRNWDTVKEKWGDVWNTIQTTTASGVNVVVEGINKMIGVINKIPGVNIPIVPKVDWGAADSAVAKSKSLSGQRGPGLGITSTKDLQSTTFNIGSYDGSHASGLASVPYDGYVAELHKDEPILTAKQGDALRSAGILKSSGEKPVLNMGGSTPESTPSKSVESPQFIFNIGGENAKDIAMEVRQVVEDIFAGLNAITP